ncbi:MAG: RecQ family ATP-dependent DNA helicase [bacterium]
MAEVDLYAALRQHFNFSTFRPGQQAAIEHVLAQRNALVVMPTGAGKSLIYQLASLLLPGVALVFSPLKALMKDQIDSLTRRGIAATFINSSLDSAEQARRIRSLSNGDYKMVLVAPERLRQHTFRAALKHVPISLLAVDEAHCLSQWGHDFRPDYLHIAAARMEFNPPVTLALTATATPRVQDDIARLLGLSHIERIVTGFDRPNLTFEVLSASNVHAKLKLVGEFLAEAEGAGIIYTGTRRDAEEVAEFVREVVGVEAQHYYGGTLEDVVRTRVQDAFIAGDLPIVVATNAFGMGIDRPDVRFVLHYALPGSLEQYYQEAGRAGRDGLPARVALIYSPKDTALQEYFIVNDSPSADELQAVHEYVRQQPHGLSFLDLQRSLGLPQTKARLAIEQLEAAKSIRKSSDESFGQMKFEALALTEADLQTIAAQVAARRDTKRWQLQAMIDYATTNACRRRIILDHFGDTTQLDAPLCCDNCLTRAEIAQTEARSAETQSEQSALIVLDTIFHLKWTVGKGTLAQILKGSAAQKMTRVGYDKARNYGSFEALKLREVEALIDQLCAAGYLKQIGGEYPTLKLTPRGEAALEARAAISVQLRPVQAEKVQRVKAQKAAGGAIALTGQLLAQGRTPDQIAAERGLVASTIYSHLAQLIAQRQIHVDAVVPGDVQEQIRAAIEKVGSVGFLTPIKALLPNAIDFSVIRCVVEAWKIERGSLHAEPALSADTTQLAPPAFTDLPLEPLRSWRHQQAAALNQPDWFLFGDGTLHQLAQKRPRTKAELAIVSGLSVEAIEKYGDEIIAVVNTVTSTEIVNAILECVRTLPGELPRSGIAKLLVGSASQRVDKFASHPLFNQLSNCNRSDVTLQVDVLLEMGCLQQDGSGHLIPKDTLSKLAASPEIASSSGLFERLREWRFKKAQATGVPAFVIFYDRTLREIAAVQPRSFQELAAIQSVGRAKIEKYGRDIVSLVAEVTRLSPAQDEQARGHSAESPDDPVAAFLSRPHPRLLKGSWLAGWALDFHSRYDGDVASRSTVGELVFRYKYSNEHQLAQDLARRWVELLATHPELPQFDAVIPVPPSTHRDFDPVSNLAQALAAQLKVPVLANVLIKTRVTQPQKEMKSLAQKQSNVAGAFALRGAIRGQRVILIDDLYDSGATLDEAARVLARGGAASLIVLTLTKTIHSDA